MEVEVEMEMEINAPAVPLGAVEAQGSTLRGQVCRDSEEWR